MKAAAFVAVLAFAAGLLSADFRAEKPQDHHAHIHAHYDGLCADSMPKGYVGYAVFRDAEFKGCLKVSSTGLDMSRPQFLKIVEQ